MTTASLVLETHNLGDSRGREDAWLETLCTCLRHLAEQSRPLATLTDVTITHLDLPDSVQARLDAAAGRPVRLVKLPAGTDYYEAKNIGFDHSAGDVVAFGDADCWPDAVWLERLLAPFDADPTVQVVAGRTTYRRDWMGAAASTIDFMYFPSPLAAGCTRNFYANNVAFRRELFAQHRYQPTEGVYRGHCQVLGLKLQSLKIPVHFVPEARTIHRFPDSFREFVRLRLLRGQDTTQLAPHLVKSYVPAVMQRAASTNPVAPLTVLGVRLGFSVAALGHQDMPPVHGGKCAKALLAIAGISALDTVGALLQVAGVPVGNASRESLEYHANADSLA